MRLLDFSPLILSMLPLLALVSPPVPGPFHAPHLSLRRTPFERNYLEYQLLIDFFMEVALRVLLYSLILTVSFGSVVRSAEAPIFLDQGSSWTSVTRADFYSRDQGSRMIPLNWLQALKQPNGQPFLADSLSRYGYLPNPANSNGLPVGFTTSGPAGAQTAGMTCAACHTRQITAEGKTYRIDGGP